MDSWIHGSWIMNEKEPYTAEILSLGQASYNPGNPPLIPSLTPLVFFFFFCFFSLHFPFLLPPPPLTPYCLTGSHSALTLSVPIAATNQN
ncbi:hypothetical protein BDV28DRAFT_54594 [Aspergillus coremiiformis]|uniref:Uncharacterized protein n=1 Tax=Aspergillus coremiiformis TaxID=138285 RepID=A0A5N6YXB3_9EURO|nr:hypothetical protein BDV28DRAFT_54594 [Aspergillus coremiiformis]